MDPLTMALIGMGVGGVKSELIDRPREKRQRKQRAAEIRYSPWSGLSPSTQIQEADPMGSAMQYGFTGASMGQNLQAADAAKVAQAQNAKLIDSQIALNEAEAARMAPPAADPVPEARGASPSIYGRNPWAIEGPVDPRHLVSPTGYRY